MAYTKKLAPCPVTELQLAWIKKEAKRCKCSQNDIVRRLLNAAASKGKE